MADNVGTVTVTTVVDTGPLKAGMDQAATLAQTGTSALSDAMARATSASVALQQAQAALKAELAAQFEVQAQFASNAELIAEAQTRVAAATVAVTTAKAEATAATKALSAAQVEAAGVTESTVAATDAEGESLLRVIPRLRLTSSGLAGTASAVGNLGVLLGAAAAAAIAFGEYALAKADVTLANLASATGSTVAGLGALQQVFDQNGVSSKQFQQVLAHVTEQMQQLQLGSKEAAEAFVTLGIPIGQVLSGSLSLTDVLGRVADKLHDNAGNAAITEAATQLLGSRDLELVGVLRQGSEAINQQAQSFAGLGEAEQRAVGPSESIVGSLSRLWAAVKEGAYNASASAHDFFAGLVDEDIAPAISALERFRSSFSSAVQAAQGANAGVGAASADVVFAQQGPQTASSQGQVASATNTAATAMQKEQAAALQLIGAIETADAQGKDHTATIEANRNAIVSLAKAMGSDAPAAINKYVSELQKADTEEAKKAQEAAKQAQQAQLQGFEAELDNLKLNHQVRAAEEQQFWQSKLAIVKSGTEEYNEILSRAAAAAQEVDRKSEATQKQIAELIAKSQEQAGKEIADELQKESALRAATSAKEYADAVAAARDQVKAEEDAALGRIAVLKQEIETEYTLGKIGTEERLAQLKAAIEEELAIKQAAAAQLAQIDAGGPDSAAKVAQDQQAAAQAAASAAQQIAQANQQAALRVERDWQQVGNTISRAFTSSLDAVINRTETVQIAFRNMGVRLVEDGLQYATQWAMRWIEKEALAEAAHLAGITVKQTQDAAAAATGKALQTAQASATIASDAGVAAAGAYAAEASIPIVGPELAPAAAAEAYSAVLAFEVASAAGGQWNVGGTQLTVLHDQEMVIPPFAAQGMRNMISQAAEGQTAAGPGGGSSTTNFHISAVDAAGVNRLLARNGASLARGIQRAQRYRRSSSGLSRAQA